MLDANPSTDSLDTPARAFAHAGGVCASPQSKNRADGPDSAPADLQHYLLAAPVVSVARELGLTPRHCLPSAGWLLARRTREDFARLVTLQGCSRRSAILVPSPRTNWRTGHPCRPAIHSAWPGCAYRADACISPCRRWRADRANA